MSWLFSQALVEEYSAATCSDGEPSAQLNVMPTPHKFWRNDKTIESSDHSRFGLTSQLLTESRGKELLTSFQADFRAKTLAGQEKEPALTEHAVDSGLTWLASFARYDRGSSTWKTVQCSLLGDSEEFLETWPRWGAMRNGESFLRPIPALSTLESASGFWQTPVADDAIERTAGKWNSRGEPKLSAEVKLWPTPTVHGNHNMPGASKSAGWGLSSAVKLWPTPTASLADKGGRVTPRKGREGGTLIEAVSSRMFPTPVADDTGHRKEKYAQGGTALSTSAGGQLNPDWEEWLMGWPIGWTALKPLEMGKFHEWQQQHSFCSADNA